LRARHHRALGPFTVLLNFDTEPKKTYKSNPGRPEPEGDQQTAMANSNRLPAVALLLLVAASVATALQFSPMDVLLPRPVAMAALRALRGASDIFPVFVGAASAGGPSAGAPDGGRVDWKGACFYENEAWLEFHNNSGSKYGGGTLHIKVRQRHLPLFVPAVRASSEQKDPLLRC
jgi:hypothetical protein